MSAIKKIALLHIDNRRLLCARTAGEELFFNVGGKQKPGETDIETLVRESKEELGVVINPDAMRYVGLFTGKMPIGAPAEYVHIHAYFANFAGEPKPCHEIEELGWLNSADAHKMPDAGGKILKHLKKLDLID